MTVSPLYNYLVKDWQGKEQKGSRTASTRKELLDALAAENYVVVDVKEQGVVQKGDTKSLQDQARDVLRKKPSSKEYMIFCRQFATMVGAGMTVLHSLEVMAEQVDNLELKYHLSNVVMNIRRGTPLAEAFKREKDFFPPILINMIEAGEAAGIMEEVLNRLAVHFEKQYDLEQKVKSATFYPIILSVVAFLIITFMVVYIFPVFERQFELIGVDLPWITRVFMGFSDMVIQYWYVIIGVIILIIYGVVKYMKSEGGQYFIDSTRLKIPVFSSIYKRTVVARFARSLSTLMTSGVELLTSLELVEGVVNNRLYSDALKRAREVIQQGQPMAPTLMSSGLFPVMLLEMIQVGEETGALDEMLSKTADMYETEVSYELERLTTIIEPILIVAIGGFIAVMVAAIILPVFGTHEMLN